MSLTCPMSFGHRVFFQGLTLVAQAIRSARARSASLRGPNQRPSFDNFSMPRTRGYRTLHSPLRQRMSARMNSLLRNIRNLAVVSVLALAVMPAVAATPASAAEVSATNSDLAYWNETLVGGFRLQTVGPTLGPATLARAAAIMHAAIFDTLDFQSPNSAGPIYGNYLYSYTT